MATWKKILLDGDAVDENLSTANLTQSATARLYDIDGTTNTLGFKNGKTKFLNSSTQDRFEFNPETRVFFHYAGSEGRYYDDDNSGFFGLKAPTQITAANSITIEWPSTPPTANQILEVQSVSSGIATTSWINTPSGSGSGISNVVEDTSPQLGGHLDTNGFRVDLDNNIPITGDNTSGANLNLAKVNTSNAIEFGHSAVNSFHLGSTYLESCVFDDDSTTSDGDYGNGGQITLLGTNTSTIAGRAYYYNSSGSWSFASVSSEEPNASLLAVATGNASNRGMLLRGVIQVSNGGTNLSTGKAVYLTANASFTTEVPTTSGHFARIVGYALDTNTIFFTPSNEYIELA